MLVSRLGLKTRKTRGTDEALYNEILFQSLQLKRHTQGIYGFGPILTIARNNLSNFLRTKLNAYNCIEVSLPVMQPKQLWEDSGRFEKYVKSGTMFTTKGKNGEYCIAPTGEEIMLDYANDIIQSYKDMPLNFYQIGNKYRDEIRARGGLLRSKEFIMKDGYSFHATPEDMAREYENMKKCYIEFFSGLGLVPMAVTANSADMGGKVSDEFMVESEIGEDTILIDDKHNLAFNVEIAQEPELKEFYLEKFPFLDFDKMRETKGIEVGHIFQLNQFYSASMNGVFVDNEGKNQFYHMGCYGIGVNRTLAAVLARFSDENGLRFPKVIRPFDVAIIALDDEELNAKASEIYFSLTSSGIKTLWDDRKLSLGMRIKDMQLIGVRNLIILGKNFFEDGLIELDLDGEKQKVAVTNLIEVLEKK